MTIPKFEWDKVVKNGVFAVLFVSLLYYVMTSNDQREKRYQETIQQLNSIVHIDLVELKAMHNLPRS